MEGINYLTLIGIILVAWGLNLVISGFFRVNTTIHGEDFFKAMVEQGTNILVFGFGGILLIFIRNAFNVKVTYYLSIVVVVIYAILLLLDVFRLLGATLPTIGLIFKRDYEGLCGTGKLADFLFILSMIVEAGVFAFITFNMYQSIS